MVAISKELSDKLRSVNVLMTLFIVMLHCTWGEPALSPIQTITDMAVPTFFTMSSFLYFKDFDFTWHSYQKKLHSRFFSLLIPFVAFNVVYYC